MKKLMKRIKVYMKLKKWGIKHPWRASGDKHFIQFD